MHRNLLPYTPDDLDPLAPRPDDPTYFGRWTRLYDRPNPRRTLLRSPLSIVLMLSVTVLVALGLILIAQTAF